MPDSDELTPEELESATSLASALQAQDMEHKSLLAAAEEVGVPREYMARAIAMMRADRERQESIAKRRWQAVGVRITALVVIAGFALGFWYFEINRPAGGPVLLYAPSAAPSRETLMMSRSSAPPPSPPTYPSLQPRSTTLSIPVTFTDAPDNPVNNGPGIVICDPVTLDNQAAGIAAFGAGCGRWLQFVVGGRGELGKTPVYIDTVRARSDLVHGSASNRDDGLTPLPAGLLGKALGVPFVATGTIQEDAGNYVLTYTLWKLPSMTEDGSPQVLSGTEAQVCAALPSLASKLLTTLGIAGGPVSAAPPAPELCDVGMVSWRSKPAPAVIDTLGAIAGNSPLAATILLDNNVPISPAALEALYRVSDNVSALYAMAGMPSLITPRLTQALDVELKHFPNNYGIACAQLRRFVYRQNINREIEVAYQLPRYSPRNPWSYYRYEQVLSDTAQYIRLSRAFEDIPPADVPALVKLYDYAEISAKRAAMLMPNDPDIALEYSEAALFNNDEKTADAWIWKAMALAPNARKPYWRALEMFQPKWTSGHSHDLLKVVAKVEANDGLFDQLCGEIVDAMDAANLGGDLLVKAEERAAKVGPDGSANAVQEAPIIVQQPTE